MAVFIFLAAMTHGLKTIRAGTYPPGADNPWAVIIIIRPGANMFPVHASTTA